MSSLAIARRHRAAAQRLAKKRANHLLDKHCAGIDLINVAVAVVEPAVMIERVARAQIIRDLVVGPTISEVAVVPLPDVVELFCLTGWHAAVVLLREPRRASTADIERIEPPTVSSGDDMLTVLAICMSVAVSLRTMGLTMLSLAVARLSERRRCESERGRARN